MISKKLKIIADFCQEYDMLPRGASVMACVSGGADSMCLLHVLTLLAPELGLSVSAAHFNHSLRGAESDGDERFVRDYCAGRGIPLYVGSGDVRTAARDSRRGLEETARRLRYEFFENTAREQGIEKIATAHTADDNLETILLHLTRGSGLAGLGGIPPVRGNIVRPILPLTRRDVEEINAIEGVPSRVDSSNLTDDYARNKLRHNVIPVLREINPQAARAALNSSALLREDEEYLLSKAREFVSANGGGRVPASELASLPRPISSRAIRLLYGSGLSRAHVEAVLELAHSRDPSARLSLPGLTLRREYGDILRDDVVRGGAFEPFSVPIDRGIIMERSGFKFLSEKIVAGNEIYNSLTTFLLKCDNIMGGLTVRPRQTGDFIKLPGRPRRSLKKIFIDLKVPSRLRDMYPVIADGDGVLAVYGIGCDTRAQAGAGDSALKITIKEKYND